MLAHGVSPVILFGKGITAQRDPQLVEALLGLATLVGAVDSERVGLLSLKGEANSQAAAQLQLESQFALNGHKPFSPQLAMITSQRNWLSGIESPLPGGAGRL
jgi:hypothetical protein